MNKRTGLACLKFLGFKGPTDFKSITLVELLIAMVVVSIMILSFYSLESYGHKEVINADRRAKIQNNLVYCLEHMSKYVQQANGNLANPPITLYPNPVSPRGFQIRFDCKSTPSDLTDDVQIYYDLSGHSLSVGRIGSVVGCVLDVPEAEVLSNRIMANFNNSSMPINPTDGFYVRIDPSGNFMDVGLVGLYDATKPYTWATRSTNPRVEIKTRLFCNNASMN